MVEAGPRASLTDIAIKNHRGQLLTIAQVFQRRVSFPCLPDAIMATESIINRKHCAIFHLERYEAGSSERQRG